MHTWLKIVSLRKGTLDVAGKFNSLVDPSAAPPLGDTAGQFVRLPNLLDRACMHLLHCLIIITNPVATGLQRIACSRANGC